MLTHYFYNQNGELVATISDQYRFNITWSIPDEEDDLEQVILNKPPHVVQAIHEDRENNRNYREICRGFVYTRARVADGFDGRKKKSHAISKRFRRRAYTFQTISWLRMNKPALP